MGTEVLNLADLKWDGFYFQVDFPLVLSIYPLASRDKFLSLQIEQLEFY